MVAAFSVHKEEAICEGALSVRDIPGLSGDKWLVYHWNEQRITRLGEGCETVVSLEPGEAELYLLLPDRAVQFIGILEKYIGPGCMDRLWEREDTTGVLVTESGTFGFVAGKQIRQVLVNGKECEFETMAGGLYGVKILEENSVVELHF